MTPPVKTPSLNPLPLKERMKVPRQHMPEQGAQIRATNFTEVNLGYSTELARQEAARCLECAKPACVNDCPVGVKVKDFVQLIVAGDYLGAAAKIREDNVLPAITGRVCPQEDHCEGGCLMGKKVQSLGIGYLERFVADYEQRHMDLKDVRKAPSTGKKVAIVGSGPSGLTAAGDLVQRGHHVHVFEALHEIGGVLVYGIPEFRLPKQIIREQVDYMRAMGVEFETDVVVGRTVTIDELIEEEGYDAVFIGTGAGLPQFMGIPGEHLNGVYSANEFLTRINLMHAYEFPRYDEPMVDLVGKNVAVIGGGNTALDAIRSALRLGAGKAYVLYRRSEAEMPARAEEAKHAKEEGIDFQVLTAPIEFLSDGKGWLTAARCQRMELGEPDASGRRRPMPIQGSEFDLPLSVAIIAIGTSANPIVQSTTPGLQTNKRGYIQADEANQRTSRKGVFAGGDIVTGSATVILAMGAGRRAAKSIHEYLTTGAW
ncbi:MAG TPA: NADPH-dependent glutamate synthase [Terriglobales bacterium]|jgi:glutamate synthase (NADPH) small chain|nr:NADPH-dependent glutamate synthase [Terriglobales bacterium]